MPWWGIALIFFGTFVSFVIIKAVARSKRPAKSALLSMICGAVSLLCVNIAGVFTGVFIPVSLLSVLVSVIGGIPGVTLLLALNMYF